MSSKTILLESLKMSDQVMNAYLGDLEDGDILIHPIPGQHNIAWQLGHLINSEAGMLNGVKPGASPALPEGFDAAYGREPEIATSEDNSRYATKATYLDLMKKQREATLAVLDSLSEEELAAPGPEGLRRMVSTVGGVFGLIGSHALMHAGQFVSVRRATKKPISI